MHVLRLPVQCVLRTVAMVSILYQDRNSVDDENRVGENGGDIYSARD